MVASPSKTEVVRHTGGWLFDHVMAGWDVTVLAPDDGDSRALEILGVRPIDLETALACRFRGRRPEVIAVDAGLYDSNRRIRNRLVRTLEEGVSEIRIWSGGTAAAAPGSATVRHRLSTAARAFKAQALTALRLPRTDEPVECFSSGDLLLHSKSA